jgi:hypothetical protein
VAAEGEDARAVPFVGDLEGALVAPSDLLDEPLVAEQRKHPLRRQKGVAVGGGGRDRAQDAVPPSVSNQVLLASFVPAVGTVKRAHANNRVGRRIKSPNA